MERTFKRVEDKIGEGNMKALLIDDDLMIWGEKDDVVQEQLKAWITYGAENLTVSESDAGKIREIGMKFMRNMLAVTSRDQIRNEIVQARSGVHDLREIIEKARMRCTKKIEVVCMTRSKNGRIELDGVEPKQVETFKYLGKTYGAETLTVSESDAGKIREIGMKFMRNMLAVTSRDQIRNEIVQARSGVHDLREIIEKARMRWYGHVQ
ncbi:uncharacterized protein LOC134541206 [Bacillus rossius redtenbacheri]|uniref:uncharacterized protein LOC134541206 n=1 Tax=Bacillus rossius redtenbacheri TaxID=93214 RepID=UPI002FDD027C